MVFEIDRRVVYRPEDGALWPAGDETSATILTLTMGRVLMCLLEKHGQVVTRNELLDQVWDAHGLRSSSHTLNKYISELRRHFVQLGIAEECIITVPRVGFLFNGDLEIKVVTAEDAEQQGESTVISMPSAKKDRKRNKDGRSSDAGAKHPFRKIPLGYLIFVTMAAIVFLAAIAYDLLAPSPVQLKAKETPTYFLFNYESCPVYTLQQNSDSLKEKKIRIFLEAAMKEKITCLNGTSFVYQASESYLYGKKGKVFISRCTFSGTNYLSCLNFYWSGHGSDD